MKRCRSSGLPCEHPAGCGRLPEPPCSELSLGLHSVGITGWWITPQWILVSRSIDTMWCGPHSAALLAFLDRLTPPQGRLGVIAPHPELLCQHYSGWPKAPGQRRPSYQACILHTHSNTKSKNLNLRFYLAQNIKICREKQKIPHPEVKILSSSSLSTLPTCATPHRKSSSIFISRADYSRMEGAVFFHVTPWPILLCFIPAFPNT